MYCFNFFFHVISINLHYIYLLFGSDHWLLRGSFVGTHCFRSVVWFYIMKANMGCCIGLETFITGWIWYKSAPNPLDNVYTAATWRSAHRLCLYMYLRLLLCGKSIVNGPLELTPIFDPFFFLLERLTLSPISLCLHTRDVWVIKRLLIWSWITCNTRHYFIEQRRHTENLLRAIFLF